MDEQTLIATRRWRSTLPMFVAGGVAIVAGGLVAAVTGPTDWERGSWVAAFLVLVAGVAQIGLAAGQAHLAGTAATGRFVRVEYVSWNVGCATVIAGTLLSNPATVAVGSAGLMCALAMSAFAIRESSDRRSPLLVYRTLLTVLLVSIPIGIALSWTRH